MFVSYLGLLSGDAVDGETSLHIVDQTEVLAGLFNADHIWVNRNGRVLASKSFYIVKCKKKTIKHVNSSLQPSFYDLTTSLLVIHLWLKPQTIGEHILQGQICSQFKSRHLQGNCHPFTLTQH